MIMLPIQIQTWHTLSMLIVHTLQSLTQDEEQTNKKKKSRWQLNWTLARSMTV